MQQHAAAEAFLAAVGHQEAGRLAESAACFRQVIAAAPGFAEAHCRLGSVLRDQGRLEDAISSQCRAIDLRPGYVQAHNNLGTAYRELGRPEDGVAACRRAVALGPAFPEPHTNLGNALRDLGRLEEAIACHRTALRLDPDSPETHNNLGAALAELGQLEAACACYRHALVLRPDFSQPHNNLGTALAERRRLPEAVASYREAIRLEPGFADAHFNLAMALLTQGDLAAGWPEYEWRWRAPQMIGQRRTFPQPQWHGEPGAGQTLLIHAEQGFGDTLQFCRYATLAAARGLTVMLEVPAPLVRLLRTLAGASQVIACGDAIPDFDLHCPMASLPLACGTTLANVPAPSPYLHADPARIAHWHTRLPPAALRVGLAWAGNPRRGVQLRAAVDQRRSIASERLAPLLEIPGVHCVSLQKDPPAAPAGFALTDLMPHMEDFADTAALIANLDLVIAVDTAVAHLAAALGRPVWLLDRFDSCWRWLDGRRDSPWYPTLRIYRQPAPGAWDPVIAEIARDLGSRAGAERR